MQNKEWFLDFLNKISPQLKGHIYPIPFPKLTSEQRKQRRLAFRNENKLYKRHSSLSGDSIISIFHEESPFVVYSQDEWWNGTWSASDYATDFDFNKSFFEQFYNLLLKVPRTALINNKAENSPYCNFADGNKNCHMATSVNWSEDTYFSFCIVNCKNAIDCIWCLDSEIVYQSSDCRNCYHLFFSEHCNNCSESAFLYDCVGMKNSIFCNSGRNGQYQIFNKQVTKDQFNKTFDYYFCGSQKRLDEAKKIFAEFLSKETNLRRQFFLSSEDISGNNICNSNNIFQGYDVFDSEDCMFLHDGLKGKDCVDICFFDGTELCYESTSLIGYGYRFTNFCRDSVDLFYCDSCYSCKDCFGCIGLRNKQYCILNKQYGKEGYEELLIRIIKKMSEDGEWGEFFPVKNSFFAYNETLAFEYYPLLEEEVLKRGWRWRKIKQSDYISEPVAIPDNIDDINKDFCNNIIACEISGKKFKVIESELNFYKKWRLPFPRVAPEQRLRQKMKNRFLK